MSDATPLLQVTGLQKSYNVPVLADFDCDVQRGEVHALVGSNGAGKSTFARILCGLVVPDAGHMSLAGRPHAPRSKREAEQAGVIMVLQELNVIGTLSIAENLFLHHLPRRAGFVASDQLYRRAREALARVGLEHFDPATPAGQLGVGQQQLVEIAGALAQDCHLLILDEPTAALTDPEIDGLFDHIRRLQAGGVGILYISHRMDEIRRIADRVTVLRDGRRIATHPAAEVQPAQLVREMVGHALPERPATSGPLSQSVALRVCELRAGERVRGVNFAVRHGEILGLSGLIGSGRTETLRAIMGADRADGGEIWGPGARTAGSQLAGAERGLSQPAAGTPAGGTRIEPGDALRLETSRGPQRNASFKPVLDQPQPESRLQVGAPTAGTEVFFKPILLPLRHEPSEAVRAGIGMVPEDRKQDGLLLPQSVRVNATLATVNTYARLGGWLDAAAEARAAESACRRLAVRCASVEQPVNELSGGNQQKVVIARWLARGCDVLLFDEPTRGIDVAAKETIYALLRELAGEGKAVVVVSSELTELMALCHRIAVMSAGRIVAEFLPDEWTPEKLTQAAFSGYLDTQRRAGEVLRE